MPLVPMVGLLICFLGMVCLGFLSFQGSVYVHLCLGVLGSISPNYCYLPASCCDGISNLICQAIYHLQSALHPFSHSSPPSLSGEGALLLPSSHFTVEAIEAQTGCPRSHSSRIGLEPRSLNKSYLCSIPISCHLFSSVPRFSHGSRREWIGVRFKNGREKSFLFRRPVLRSFS